MSWRTTVVLTSLLCLRIGPAAHARPAHKKSLADHYGQHLAARLNDCRTCHVPDDPDDSDAGLDSEDKPHNAFGARLKAIRDELRKAGKKSGIPGRLEAVAGEDSDGDGVANAIELLTGHYPGEADDTPGLDEVARGRRTLETLGQQKVGYAWAPFEPLTRPAVPRVEGPARIRNPIDAFVAAEHEARGLTPRPEAPRAVLLRRLYLDLTGLPPTVEELHAFLEDEAPDAYEAVVDRLLASPRYGERWGRHWMDVWRYSDWAGYGKQVRDSLPHIWGWRDWIVESLNRDKGYDRMVVEMLAGDELAPDDPEALRATGYLVRNYKLLSREKWMQDVVDHTSQAFLGLTLGCAKCHDHMYDPILQSDYYRVRAIFEPHRVRTDRVPGEADTAKAGLPRAFDAVLDAKTFLFIRGDDRNPAKQPLEPGVPEALGGTFPAIEPVALPVAAYAPDRRPFVVAEDLAAAQSAADRARTAREELGRSTALELGRFGGSIGAVVDPAWAQKKLESLESAGAEEALTAAKYAALDAVLKVEGLEEDGQKETEGWTRAATEAARAQRTLALRQAAKASIAARLARRSGPAAKRAEQDKALADAVKALAKAEADALQPATTAYAKRPATTYPVKSTGRRLAFARWIASRDNPLTARVAMNQVWLRHFGQAIVPSVSDFGRNGRPPSHPALLDWLAAEFMDRGWSMKAMHRLIVTSAAYRRASTPDPAALAIDPDNAYLWRVSPRRMEAEAVRDCVFAVAGTLDPAMGGPDIAHEEGLTKPRRSLYFQHAAEKQMEFLQIFDGPSVVECYRRHESTLPQQALALANSDLTARQSRLLARALAARVGPDTPAFAVAAFERVLSRPPTNEELSECLAFLDHRARQIGQGETPTQAAPVGDADGRSPSPDPALRARENLVHVLLNHHEFVTIR